MRGLHHSTEVYEPTGFKPNEFKRETPRAFLFEYRHFTGEIRSLWIPKSLLRVEPSAYSGEDEWHVRQFYHYDNTWFFKGRTETEAANGR